MDKNIILFIKAGLSEQKAHETIKNRQLTENLKNVIEEILKYEKGNKIKVSLLYHLASKIPNQILNFSPLICKYIAEEKIDSVPKIDEAINYLLHNANEEINFKMFEEACGIGVTYLPEDIEKEVEKSISKYKKEIQDKRYSFNSGIIMQEVRATLKWADGKIIKNEIDLQLLDILGEKKDCDIKIAKLKKNSKNKSKEDGSIESKHLNQGDSSMMSNLIKSKCHFHKPGENYKTDGYVLTCNTKRLLMEHLSKTGGLVITRFPPEPNGILHIGHAKAININFGYAAAFNGLCYLRYDDTNPEKEEEKFVTGIKDIVTWLGYTPAKITYSSDYFDQLFHLANCLINKGFAYACHQSSHEIKGYQSLCSPWKNRSLQRNLSIMRDMKDGLINEGEATLRMNVTLEEGKQDPVAYRIKFFPHHRTLYKWCVYPTYDFTHCLCDSIENITHSLCTKEFQSRRSSYYWLCNVLDIYCPVQWEYGRLNVSHTVVSKRKIAKLIEKKIVENWDDPRLFTLSALRRRGYPPTAINNFCAQMGLTGAQTIVDPSVLEAAVRDELNSSAPRHMAVIEPLKLIISNFPFNKPVKLKVPNFPTEPNKGYHSIVLDRVVYIDSSDFRENAENNFKRLTINQSVGLKYAGFILSVKKVYKNVHGIIKKIVVHQEKINETSKPRAFIHWVSQPSIASIRCYNRLFNHRNPEEISNGFLNDINYRSKMESYIYVDKYFLSDRSFSQTYQFERMGYFSIDSDSTPKNIIFNRTVTLKEAATK